MKRLLAFIFCLTAYCTAYSQTEKGYSSIKFDDNSFASIASSLNGAGIVGLGESTHWSKEMTAFKVQFIKYLMVNTEYRALVLEDNFYECSQINNYLQTGEGDVEALYKQLMGVWQSPDFLELLKWMRAHNAQQTSADKKVFFYGADMQRGSAVQELITYTTVHSSTSFRYLEKLAERGLNLRNQPKAIQAGIVSELAEAGSILQRIGKQPLSKEEHAHLLLMQQQFETLKQYYTYQTAGVLKWATYRDKKMAENISWVKQQEHAKGNKVVVWAHNGHLQNTNLKMGKYLKQAHADYFILAQDFISGYTKSNKQRVLHYPIAKEEPLAANYFLEKDGSTFFIHFHQPGFDKSDVGQYLQNSPLLHDEGVSKNNIKLKPRKQFDALIIHRTTSPKF